MSSEENLYKHFQEKPSRETLVDKLSAEIEANLNNDQFGVDSLAQSMGMSRSSLHRKLHKISGISTSQFIREYRLKRALEILKQENITASEAAYRVGFSSATYFSTCFHKFFGYPPGEVKSRTSTEVEEGTGQTITEIGKGLPMDSGTSKTTKSWSEKPLLWVGLLLVLIASAIFFYNASSKDDVKTLAIGETTDKKSIAVLPFKNLTGKPDLEYVSDGMTDAVISRLTKVSAIDKVIPFTSTLSYKKTDKTIDEIGAELGVSTLLQGNLQISGDRIKINLQLIDAKTSKHIWSEEYAREWQSDEIFKIQTEVVEGIAKNMNVVIDDSEFYAIQKVPTKNKVAYTNYLQAEFQRNKANKTAYANAIPMYEKAIALDSNFVEAYKGLANVWSFRGLTWGLHDEQSAWKNAKKLLEKALEIDPTNEEVEEELHSGYFYYDWNFEKVERYYNRILNDSFFDITPAIKGDYAIKTGRYQNAVNAIDGLILTDPSIGVLFFFKAEALAYLGETEEAKVILNNTYSLHDDNFFYLRESIKINYYLGDYEKSKSQLKKMLGQFPDYPPILIWLNAVYAQMEGNTKAAAKYLDELLDKYNDGSSGSPAWFIALYYAHTKEYEKTFEWLKKSYDRHEVEMTWLREEPLLAPIRNDARYKALYEKVGFSKIGLPIKPSSEIQSL